MLMTIEELQPNTRSFDKILETTLKLDKLLRPKTPDEIEQLSDAHGDGKILDTLEKLMGETVQLLQRSGRIVEIGRPENVVPFRRKGGL